MGIPTLKNHRVLIIEDDAALRSLLARHLKQLGCEVGQAGTSAEARQELNRPHDYEVVVADIHLPDGDVLAVARESHARTPDLPFIFITGDHDATLFENAMEEHPAGYLMKPFELVELDALVVHTIEHQPNHGPGYRSAAERDVSHAIRSTGTVKVLLRRDATEGRPSHRNLYLKLAGVAGLILLIAFGIGYLATGNH